MISVTHAEKWEGLTSKITCMMFGVVEGWLSQVGEVVRMSCTLWTKEHHRNQNEGCTQRNTGLTQDGLGMRASHAILHAEKTVHGTWEWAYILNFASKVKWYWCTLGASFAGGGWTCWSDIANIRQFFWFSNRRCLHLKCMYMHVLYLRLSQLHECYMMYAIIIPSDWLVWVHQFRQNPCEWKKHKYRLQTLKLFSL